MSYENLLYVRYVSSALNQRVRWKALQKATDLDTIEQTVVMMEEANNVSLYLDVILREKFKALGFSYEIMAGKFKDEHGTDWFIRDRMLWFGCGEYEYQWNCDVPEWDTETHGRYMIARREGMNLIFHLEDQTEPKDLRTEAR